MGDSRGWRVAAMAVDHHLDAVPHQHLKRGGEGRLGESVGVHAQEERSVDVVLLSILTDRLGDGQDVRFVEGPLEGRATMARGAKRHAMFRHGGIGTLGIIGRHQPGKVHQHRWLGGCSCQRMDRHDSLLSIITTARGAYRPAGQA
jgi:hypothetical protein